MTVFLCFIACGPPLLLVCFREIPTFVSLSLSHHINPILSLFITRSTVSLSLSISHAPIFFRKTESSLIFLFSLHSIEFVLHSPSLENGSFSTYTRKHCLKCKVQFPFSSLIILWTPVLPLWFCWEICLILIHFSRLVSLLRFWTVLSLDPWWILMLVLVRIESLELILWLFRDLFHISSFLISWNSV